jgi:phosphoenolpyruvate-protein phosphotransferase
MSLEFTFVCPLPNGLHARPASHLAGVANEFVSAGTLTNMRSGSLANLKSVLSIIAADVRQGDECSVRVTGADEDAACARLRQFISHQLPALDQPLPAVSSNGRRSALPRLLQAAGDDCHFGVAVSHGMGHGEVVIVEGIALPRELKDERATDPIREQQRLQKATAAVRARIEAMMSGHQSSTETAVLDAHLAILSDVSLAEKLAERIASGRSAGQAIIDANEFFVGILRRAQSLYTRERVGDVQDICRELLEETYGSRLYPAAVKLTAPSVVVAESLTPQQFLALDRQFLQGLVLANAGHTSHTVILARSFGIPTVVGVADAHLVFSPGKEVMVDANHELVVAHWTPALRRFYQREWKTLQRRQSALARHTSAPAVTTDGRRLEVAANVSSSEELSPAFEQGAEGIGLFRTEMLFVGRDNAPSEDEQFETYASAVRVAAGRPIIIRTFDVGGDKTVPYLDLPQEGNPFLGYRGVRVYPAHQELLRSQLRAILRASAAGPVQIMVPMVSSLAEVLWFKAQVAEVQSDLEARAFAFDAAVPIGIMIEVPVVGFILDSLCREVDFFSIGTNDLSQYFLAADRDSDQVAHLACVRHPGFLRFLKQIVDVVHKAGKWVGMCGEMAGDVHQMPLLLGLGLDEISVAASEIPALKQRISRLSMSDCVQLLSHAMTRQQTDEVDALLLSEQPSEPALPLLDEELVVLNSESASKEEAIAEIVDALYIAGRTENRQQVEEAVWTREAVYSTGLGYGFAIPHCKTDAVAADSIGILKLQRPIEWGALDGKPVSIVILLAIRESNPNSRHMQILSQLARKLMSEGFRDQFQRIENPKAMLTFLSQELDITS